MESLTAKLARALLAPAVLAAALAGCAPSAGDGAGGAGGSDSGGGAATQRIEVEGVITAIAAASGGRDYILEVRDFGVLPLALPDAAPSPDASGVVIEVPASLAVPEDPEGVFAALADYAGEADESLVVVDYLP
ncbi:MAG: hypothetical protein KF727_11060 [Microbacteriaceae bacterium]|nr:hypothetical protein [Microbacteriaceae bacterium]